MNKQAILDVVKEVGRWVIFFSVSAFITQTLAQISLVPENATIKLWVFVYSIPIRTILFWALSIVQRIIDRWMHNADITSPIYKLIEPLLPKRFSFKEADEPKGLLNF